MTINNLRSRKILPATIIATVMIMGTLAGAVTSNPSVQYDQGNNLMSLKFPKDAFAQTAAIPGTTATSQPREKPAVVPFTLAETHTLPDKTVLIYEGVSTQIGGSQSISMGGFTAPATGIVAKTTWIVADGQSGSPTGGVGVSTSINFNGGAPVTFGPPAITGADGAANGNYLWDSETHDVSTSFSPGATSATASMTSNVDCLTWQAQVLDLGSAGAMGGYAADGIGLRNRASGTIMLTGIASGSSIDKANLYWGILSDTNPGNTIMVNGSPVTGTLMGTDVSPCWAPTTYWGFKADVTSLVSGNGPFVISGYPTGQTNNADPFTGGDTPPLAEGASLVVVFAPSVESKLDKIVIPDLNSIELKLDNIINTILPAIQVKLDNIVTLLTDPQFGLKEIKKEIQDIQNAASSGKFQRLQVDMGVAKIADKKYEILTTELGQPVDVTVVEVKEIKASEKDTIKATVLTPADYTFTNLETGVNTLKILGNEDSDHKKSENDKSSYDVIVLQVQRTDSNGIVNGTIIFDKEVNQNTNQ